MKVEKHYDHVVKDLSEPFGFRSYGTVGLARLHTARPSNLDLLSLYNTKQTREIPRAYNQKHAARQRPEHPQFAPMLPVLSQTKFSDQEPFRLVLMCFALRWKQ